MHILRVRFNNAEKTENDKKALARKCFFLLHEKSFFNIDFPNLIDFDRIVWYHIIRIKTAKEVKRESYFCFTLKYAFSRANLCRRWRRNGD